MSNISTVAQNNEWLNRFNVNLKEMELRALVLSDLHFRAAKDESPDAQKQRKKIIDSLIAELGKQEGTIDLVLVAGDLANHASEGGYEQMITFLQQLQKLPALKYAVFWTCPGNHDRCRLHKKAHHKAALHQLLRHIKTIKHKESYTTEALADMIYSVIAKGAGTQKKSRTSLLKAISQYEQQVFATYNAAVGKLKKAGLWNTAFERQIPGLDDLNTVYAASVLGVDILSVNSSWFCGLFSRDKEKLFLLHFLVEELVKQYVGNSGNHQPVTLGLMHHPHYWLHESEYNAAAGSVEEGFGALCRTVDMIIHGHEHGQFKRPHSFNQDAHIVVNGCTYTDDTLDKKCWPATFGILTIRKIAKTFRLERYLLKQDKKNFIWEALGNPHLPCDTTYLRQPSNWNFNVDEQRYWQRIQVVDFLYKQLKVSSGMPTNLDCQLLQKQILEVWVPPTGLLFELSVNDRNGCCIFTWHHQSDGVKVLALPASLIEKAGYEPEKLLQNEALLAQLGKATFKKYVLFVYQQYGQTPENQVAAAIYWQRIQFFINNFNIAYGLSSTKHSTGVLTFHKILLVSISL